MEIKRNKKGYEVCKWDLAYSINKRFKQFRLQRLAEKKDKPLPHEYLNWKK